MKPFTVMQLLPELEVGGVERGTVEIAQALLAAGHRAVVVSAGGRLVEELQAVGAEHVELAIGEKHLRVFRTVSVLRELYQKFEVDLVHARSRLPAWIGWLARRRLPRALQPRWVTTVHGPYTVNAYSRVMTSGERVIAISDFIRDYILDNYPNVAAERLRVIPRGVDSARFHHRFEPDAGWLAAWHRAHPDLDGQAVLSLPARLTRWKGQEAFIDVIARLRGAGQRVHGLLIGAAHQRKPGFEQELRALAERRGVAEHVSFLGQRDDLRELLSISNLALSLTLEPEAFGRTTVEALALGTPVVGYEHGGTGEILRRVYPQGLVPPLDSAAAAARCQALLMSPAAVPAAQPYTTAALQSATLAVYEELIGDQSDKS